MPPSRDEHELIRAAAAGDRGAFDELIRLKRERVVRTAYQITGDMDDALDVAQGVFLKLWHGLERFDPRRRFDTWVYRITVNAAIDMLRSRGPRGVLQPLPPETAEIGAVTEADADESLDLRRLQQAFLRLAGGLAPKQRTAFVLREIEGHEIRGRSAGGDAVHDAVGLVVGQAGDRLDAAGQPDGGQIAGRGVDDAALGVGDGDATGGDLDLPGIGAHVGHRAGLGQPVARVDVAAEGLLHALDELPARALHALLELLDELLLEIVIVALDGDTLVFIEVKTRSYK